MNTENTNTGGDQQTQTGATGGEANQAANPEAQGSTATPPAEGQGNGGDAGSAAGNEGTQGDKAAGDGQQQPPAGAPEQYEQFTVPEGYVLEGPRLEMAIEKFKGWGFNQAQAQEAIDAFCKADGENATIMQAAAEQATAQKREAWGQQAMAKFGDKFDAEVAYAKTALANFGTDELITAFVEEGWGNHPAMLEFFGKIGRLSRDSSMDGIGSQGGTQTQRSIEDRMYPSKT